MSDTKYELLTTEDMGLSVALLCNKHELVEMKVPPIGRRVTFCFQATNKTENIIQSYWAGRLPVDAKQFWNESKNLKTRLYSLK